MLQKNRQITYKRSISFILVFVMLIALLFPTSIHQASAAVTAKPEFSKTTKTIYVGDTYKLVVKNKIAGASYTWKSSDKSIAKVSKSGVVTGIKKGTANISCTIISGELTYKLKCKISVKIPAESITITNKTDYLLVGETYDLNHVLSPSGSNDKVSWTSSNTSIIKPDKNGAFTALKLGTATITVTTLSGVTDSVTIYVVEEKEKVISHSDVENGKIKLSNKSYGDLCIDNSVGDVQIELTNVTVGGTLIMEDGAAYTVTTNTCTIHHVAAVKNYGISSFAVENGADSTKETPSLVAGKGSLIVTIDSECNISVKQTNGATIQSFSVTTNADASINIALEGFTGDLIIDSQSKSVINIETTACAMSSATVLNSTEGQKVTLSDTNAGTEQASTIQTVNLSSNAALTVNVKADKVVVSDEATQADVVIQQPVTELINKGEGTSLSINSQISQINSTGNTTAVSMGKSAIVGTLTVSGTDTKVELKDGATVSAVTSTADNTKVVVAEGSTIKSVATYGDSSTVEGTGSVEKAIVTGSNSQVNTKGTEVQVAQGTTNVKVNGVEVKEEEKVAIATPTPAPTATPTPTPKATATPTPKATVIPTPKPTVAPTPTSSPVIVPYVPSPGNSTTNPTPDYSKEYQAIIDKVIKAANNNDKEAVYAGLVELFDKKLATASTAAEWSKYKQIKDANGNPNVDKNYLLSWVQSRLKAGSDQDASGNKINTNLYMYVINGSATNDQIEKMTKELAECVAEGNSNGLKTVVSSLYKLVDALIAKDANTTYTAMEALLPYMGWFGVTNLDMRDKSYAKAYMMILREGMLKEDNDEKGSLPSFYNEIYKKYKSAEEVVYTTDILDISSGACFGSTWILETGDSENAKNAADYVKDYYAAAALQDEIVTLLYDSKATDDTKFAALTNIFTLFSNNPKWINDFMGDIPGFGNFTCSKDHLNLYIDAIRIRMSDSTKESGNGDTWYVYGGYEFNNAWTNNKAYGRWQVSAAGNDIIRAVISVERLENLNTLYKELNEDDASGTYTQLQILYKYYKNVLLRTDSFQGTEYTDSYMETLTNSITNVDLDNGAYNFNQLYKNNGTAKYSTNIQKAIDQAAEQIYGDITDENLITEYKYTKECKEYQVIIDKVITAANNNDKEAVYTDLVELFDKKLATASTAAEWSTYKQIKDADGNPNVDKDYLLSWVQYRLGAGSETDDNGNIVNSNLYAYIVNGSTTNDQINEMTEELARCVADGNEDGLKDVVNSFYVLIKALLAKDADATYTAMEPLLTYMSWFGVTNLDMRDESYAEAYMMNLRESLLKADNYEKGSLPSFYNEIYKKYESAEEVVYTRDILDISIGACYGSTWILTTGDSEDAKNAETELKNYYEAAPLQDEIITLLYDDTATDDAKFAALTKIFTLLPNNSKWVSDCMGDIPGISNFAYSKDHFNLYIDAINNRMSDSTTKSENGNTWYVYGGYVFNDAWTNNKAYGYWQILEACNDIIRAVISVERLNNLNALCAALKNKDVTGTYNQLQILYNYNKDVLQKTDSFQGADCAEFYFETLTNSITNVDLDNGIYNFNQLYNSNGTANYSTNIQEAIDQADNQIYGEITIEDLIARYTDGKLYGGSVTTIINAVNSVSEDALQVAVKDTLNLLLGEVNLSSYGYDGLALDDADTASIISDIEGRLAGDFTFTDGGTNWIYYYKYYVMDANGTITDAQKVWAASRCIEDILWLINNYPD